MKIGLSLSLAALACAGSIAYAVPFDNGTADGVVSVPGDYATLADAANAFNALSGGINANWTLQIVANSLTEPANFTFGNAMNGKSLTIKPGAGFQPVVQFTVVGDNAGCSGHMIFGPSNLLASGTTYPAMGNITIDGSNNGTATRDLTLRVPVGSTAVNSRVIRVRGDVNGFTLKNTILDNNCTNGQSHGLELSCQAATVPRNILVDNCSIQSGKGNFSSTGIQCSSTGTVPSGTVITPIVIRKSTVRGGTRGIFLSKTGNVTIEDNTLSAETIASAYISEALYDYDSNGFTGWTHTIQRNVIDKVQNAASGADSTGLIGMWITPVGPGTINVLNNTVGGTSETAAPTVSGGAVVHKGIVIESPTSTANVIYNSVNLPAQSAFNYTTNTTVMLSYGIGGNSTYANPVVLQNNIVRVAQAGTSCAFFSTGGLASGKLTLDYNDYFPAVGMVGRIGATNSATLADWQTATSKEANSVSIDPTVGHGSYTGVWTSPTNLRFTGNPGNGFAGLPVPSVTSVDLDNLTRSATAPYKGAAELPGAPLTAAVGDWQVY